MAVADLDDTRHAPGRLVEQLPRAGDLLRRARGHHPGGNQGQPQHRFEPVHGRRRAVESTLDAERDVTEVVDVLEEAAVDLLLEPQDHGKAKPPREGAVAEGVTHGQKRTPFRRARVEIHEQNVPADLVEQLVDRPEHLGLLAVLGDTRPLEPTGTNPADDIGGPLAVEVLLEVARVPAQRLEVPRDRDQLAAKTSAIRLESLQNALQRLDTGPLVSVNPTGDDQRGTGPVAHDPPQDAFCLTRGLDQPLHDPRPSLQSAPGARGLRAPLTSYPRQLTYSEYARSASSNPTRTLHRGPIPSTSAP